MQAFYFFDFKLNKSIILFNKYKLSLSVFFFFKDYIEYKFTYLDFLI